MSALNTVATPRGAETNAAAADTAKPIPRVPSTASATDRSSSARRTTTSITMHAATVPDSAAESRSSAMTPKLQPLTSKMLEAIPETSLAWPTPRRGTSSTGRPSGRTSSKRARPGEVSSTSGTTSGTSSRCRSANVVTPHRAPIPAPPPLLDVGRTSGGTSAPHGRHHDPGTGHRLNLTALGGAQEETWTFHAHPSEAPTAVYEAEAANLSHEDLKAAVRTLREDVRVLNTGVERDRAQLSALQSGMHKLYADVERQQESITNTLLRRIHRVKRAKERLQLELHQIEKEKADRRAKLAETRQSVGRVRSHMKREEESMVLRLKQKLHAQQQQREQLDSLLEEHAASLQTLETLVNEVNTMDIMPAAVTLPLSEAASPAPGGTPLKRVSGLSTSSAPASAPRSPHSRPAAAAPVAARRESEIVPLSPSYTRRDVSSSPAPASTPPPPTAGAPYQRERSSSAVSVASSSAVPEQTAYDPRDMVAYLEQEIAAVESMRQDVIARANEYEAKCAELSMRLHHSERVKGESKRRLSEVEHALEDTSAKATAIAVAQQLASEVESERMVNEALAEGRSPPLLASTPPSVNVTPRHSFTRSPNALLMPLQTMPSGGVPSALVLPASQHNTADTSFAEGLGSSTTLSAGGSQAPPQQPQPRVSQLSVQSTARMEPPRPLVSSAEVTPSRSPQCPCPDSAQGPPPPLNLNA